MGKETVINVLRGILIPFINKNTIYTITELSRFTNHDRVAIKKYVDLYVDLMILIKYEIKGRSYYTINRKYQDLFKESDIMENFA